MAGRNVFMVGGVTLEVGLVGKNRVKEDLFKWVEKGRSYQRWIMVSRKEMDWIMGCIEVASKSWSYFCREKFGEFVVTVSIEGSNAGRKVRIMTLKEGRARSIFIPQMKQEGWKKFKAVCIENNVEHRSGESNVEHRSRSFKDIVLNHGTQSLVIVSEHASQNMGEEVVVSQRGSEPTLSLLSRSVVAEAWSEKGWMLIGDLMQKFNVGQKEDQGLQWWWVGKEAVLLDCGNQENASSILHEWWISTYYNECYIQRWHQYVGFSEMSNFKQAF